MAAKWFVARTRPRVESIACSKLVRDGLEIFLPRVKSPYTVGKSAESLLFPGYLFIRCDPETNGWPIFRMEHQILGWLEFDGVIPALPDEDIKSLTTHINDINGEGGIWRRYQAGEIVDVVSPTVSGLAEVLEEAKSPRSRVKVLMEFMGRLVPAQIPWENIKPLEHSQHNTNDFNHRPRRTRGHGRWIRKDRQRSTAGF